MSRSRHSQRRTQSLLIVAILVVITLVLAIVIGAALGEASATPDSPPPTVEPVRLMALSAAEATAANAEQPFVAGRFPAARPFHFSGDAANSARAADCLTAALLYEAGDDADGQRAVAQVILNRVRHPAFPKSVCGVIFQGSERATGCQFTFTCDGALARRYGDAAWARARGIAIDAMTGAVDARVGLATHYHTNWVRPYWSPSLDKLAQVGTHLFFRWPGFWGSPAAFRGNGTGQEPLEYKLAPYSASHAGARAPLGVDAATPALVDQAAVAAAVAAVVPRRNLMLGDTIILTLERGQGAESFPALAQAACGSRPYCKVMAWTNPQLRPSSEDMSDMARASMSFSYLRDEGRDLERALWNCDEFARDNAAQCMRR